MALLTVRGERVLIDVDVRRHGRFEIWERRWADRCDECSHTTVHSFIEALDTARHGAPRPFCLEPLSSSAGAVVIRRLAREARQRGWVPIAVSMLASSLAAAGDWPCWLEARSLAIFLHRTDTRRDALEALARLASRDARPHLLVDCRRLDDDIRDVTGCREIAWPDASITGSLIREAHAEYMVSGDALTRHMPTREARARWTLMMADLPGPQFYRDKPSLDLASVLIRRGQTFEARALLAERRADPLLERHRSRLARHLDRTSRTAAAFALRRRDGEGALSVAGRKDMVDDFVGVLQLCQDTEDERIALSRVGAYLRERLQATSVAFVVRDGPSARAVASAGVDQATLDAALTAIDSGCAVAAREEYGPTESAAPVRYAADVIGAVWARWGAGMPVSRNDASALLGVTAVAAAPSLRGVLDRERPTAAGLVPELVGNSAGICKVREAVVRAAKSPFPVLIEGESGTGKELVARAIHGGSMRRDRRFWAMNCAALVDDLVEAELFGHVRGAFTGAQVDRSGLFEEASGGTLFLDEVAELGSRVQAKLLRTLQEGEVRRVGEAHTRRVDVRIVAATNRPLAQEVNAGRFRRDLWYRLDVIRIAIPPVRERLEDIPLLVRQAWSELTARTGSRALLSTSATAALGCYDWPGNVRELQNVLASLLVSAPRRGVVGASMLPAHIARAAAMAPASTLEVARRQFEIHFVRAALARANGRTAIAARELGLTRQGLAKVLTRLGLGAPGDAPTAHVE